MTDAGARTVVTRAAVTRAVDIGRRALLDLQDQRGFWPFDQPAEVDSTAEDLLFREFTGQQDATLAAATARWIRSRQYPDGGWPARDAGPADLSVSVLAYCALRLAGDSTDAYHMALAAGWIRDAGGLAAAGVRLLAVVALGPAAGSSWLGQADGGTASGARRAPPGPAPAVQPGRAADRRRQLQPPAARVASTSRGYPRGRSPQVRGLDQLGPAAGRIVAR